MFSGSRLAFAPHARGAREGQPRGISAQFPAQQTQTTDVALGNRVGGLVSILRAARRTARGIGALALSVGTPNAFATQELGTMFWTTGLRLPACSDSIEIRGLFTEHHYLPDTHAKKAALDGATGFVAAIDGALAAPLSSERRNKVRILAREILEANDAATCEKGLSALAHEVKSLGLQPRGDGDGKPLLLRLLQEYAKAWDPHSAILAGSDLANFETDLYAQAQRGTMSMRTIFLDGSPTKVATIRIPVFYGASKGVAGKEGPSSSDDVRTMLRTAERFGAKAVVLDLRDNPGGPILEGMSTVGRTIGGGAVVGLRPREGYATIYGDGSDVVSYRGTLVVLVNDRTTSSAEIVAGALDDYRRALIFGDGATFGKGTSQTPIPLKDFDVVPMITTATFHTPSGRSPQRIGVTPGVRAVCGSTNKPRVSERDLPRAIAAEPLPAFRASLDRVNPPVRRAGDQASSDPVERTWRPVTQQVLDGITAELERRKAERNELCAQGIEVPSGDVVGREAAWIAALLAKVQEERPIDRDGESTSHTSAR